MSMQDEWPDHTFMTRLTITDMLERNEIKMSWACLLSRELVHRTAYTQAHPIAPLYAVSGGIGKFMEDCTITLAVIGLEKLTAAERADADYAAKTEYERRWKEPWEP